MTTSTSFAQRDQQTTSEEALRAFAVRFRQKPKDVNLYSAVLLLKDVLGRSRPDTYRHDNRNGYQRR